jgi:uncharacterized protein (DUF885 family)
VATAVRGDPTVAGQLDRIWLDLVWRDPEQVTDLGVAALAPGRPDVADKLTEIDDAYADETAARVRSALDEVRALDPATMSPADQLTARMLEWYLDDLVRGEPYRHHDYVVSQMFTVQNALPEFLTALQPVRTPAEARAYVERLGAVGPKIDQLARLLDARAAEGLLPPRFILADAAAQLEEFTRPAPREHALYASLAQRLDDVPGLADGDREALLAEAEEAIRSEVYPAYGRLRERLTTLEGQAGEEAGVWRLPAGDAYYAWALRHHTTSDLTPDEVHRRGLAAVAEEQAGLRRALSDLGYDGEGELAAELGKAAQDRGAFEPLASDADRRRVLDDYQRLIDEAAQRLADVLPGQLASPLVVQRVPAYREGGGGAYYLAPPLDGTRPGTFFVALGGDTALRTTRATTAYHEGVPGHHLQLATQRALDELPLLRRGLVFNAYAEGWALYAERLAAEEGLYADDPLGDLGRRQLALFRAARMVVDSGLHAKRWTRAQAVDYLVKETGLPRGYVEAEVDRYIAWPGQAASYYVGYQAILALREEARRSLGERFDLRDFHERLLRLGSLPLPLLSEALRASR